VRVRLSKRARPALLAIGALAVAGALATAALASSAKTSSFNWSTAKSVKAGGGMKALIKAAKKEGTLNLIATPANWANYGAQFKMFHKKYGIKIVSANPSGTSAQEIQAIKDLKGRSSAPDVVDVGGPYASAGKSQGLLAPYKVMTWKNIPKNQKAKDGSYWQDYGGFISFGCNMNLLGATPCPTTWGALKQAKYKNDIDLNGSPLSANAALSGVWAAAINNGGSAKNIKPGVDFFHQLRSMGNFNATDCNASAVIATSCPITLNWDYLNSAKAWGLTGATHWKVVDPKGIPFGGFYVQAISKYAPHPAAARLWEEFLYSTKGQNNWLKGGARPVELAAMIAAGTANKAALKALPKVSNVSKAVIPTTAQANAAAAYIAQNW
jgi:putative spermidine/putrescine transport system substrate-binding protein